MAEQIRHHYPGISVELVVIKTQGDIMRDVSLAKIGGKGLFVKEIEENLLRGDVDLAVHSMKDVPAELPDGLEISLTPKREDPRDVLISRAGMRFEDMPRGSRIGTGSLRRGIQIRNRMDWLEVVPIRGNLDTRIRKVSDNLLDGVIVAAAGMKRMGWEHRISHFLQAEVMLPAACQGILGIETRKQDPLVADLRFLQDEQTHLEMAGERAFLKRLGGGCQMPVAVYGRITGGVIRIDALIGTLDGGTMIRQEISGPSEEADQLGDTLAANILSQGGKNILDDIYATEQ
ncbi:MAG TPA: hydroxymethylbilane synthase [Syntrophales bacterium]|nr:hydroxymethylbilane synthase [Syntrophales bacterium]HQA82079.1 hydroxymethylbilane synthase [Syntrophales bacterium]